MCMLFSLVVVLAIAVPQSRFGVEARPSGAASCLPGPNVFPSSSPHFIASGALGTLMDAGIVVSFDGSAALDFGTTVLVTGQSYELELSGVPFKGFLQRLSSGGTDTDLSGSFSIPAGETNAKRLESVGEEAADGGWPIGVCAATVAGATHLDGRNDKTSVKTTIEIPANQVGNAFLEITVMVNTVTWYYSSYPLAITDPSVPGASELKPAASDASDGFVLSLFVGLIFTAPVFFLSL
jgi:hypothetical protein